MQDKEKMAESHKNNHITNDSTNNNILTMKNTKSNKENKPTFKEVYDKAQALKSINQHKYAESKELEAGVHPELRVGEWYGKEVLIYPTYNASKDPDSEEIEVKQISGQRIREDGDKKSFSNILGSFYIIGCKPEEIGNYKKIRSCEGIATGEKVYLGGAKETPVLCYLSKGYFRKFLENFRCAYPHIKMEIACDIDAIKDIGGVVKEFGYTDIWIAKPTLNEEEEVEFRKCEQDSKKQPDFWDLWKVGGKERVREELEKAYKIKQDAGTIARNKAKLLYDNAIFVKSQEDHKFLADKHIAYWNDLKVADYEDNKMLLIPMFNHDLKFQTLQMITEDGERQFYPEASETGNFAKVGFNKKEDLREVDTIAITIDYETADSIHQATNEVLLVTLGTDNLFNSSIISIAKKYTKPQLKLVVNNMFDKLEKGIIENYACLRKHGCGLIYPVFNKVERQEYKAKYDIPPISFNDLLILKGKDAVRKQYYYSIKLVQSEAEKELRAGKKPYPYIVNDEGLFLITIKKLTNKERDKEKKNRFEEVFDDREEEIILEWISGRVEVVAQTRGEEGGDWGTVVKFKDQDQNDVKLTLPKSNKTNNCENIFTLLETKGLQITTDPRKKRHLIEYIFNTPNPNRAWSTDKVGWFKNFFVLPNCIIPETDEVILQKDYALFNYGNKGSLEEWQQNVAIHCEGNSRLILALAAAFAAPLLPKLGSESYGINFLGNSSIGKSTTLKVAASVYGGHNYIQQWNSTGNALESVAEGHNHTLLCLDEMSQCDPNKIGEIAYMLANGQGKNRLNRESNLKKKYSWNTIFLSTGEKSISDRLQEYGKQATAGMEVRCIDVPADAKQGYTLFDTIHDFKHTNDLTDYMRGATNKYYGTPIIEFLNSFLGREDAVEVLNKARGDIKKKFFKEYIKDKADGQVKRVAGHFVDLIASI